MSTKAGIAEHLSANISEQLFNILKVNIYHHLLPALFLHQHTCDSLCLHTRSLHISRPPIQNKKRINKDAESQMSFPALQDTSMLKAGTSCFSYFSAVLSLYPAYIKSVG